MERYEIQAVVPEALDSIAHFLSQQQQSQKGKPSGCSSNASSSSNAHSIRQRLQWLLLDSAASTGDAPLGYCIRDAQGAIRGIDLCFPASFVAGEQRVRALGSGSFFVDAQARSMGFYLFRKYLATPGYSFYFAASCNGESSQLWRQVHGSAVPDSDTEYVLPLRLDVALPAYVATRTASTAAAQLARLGGRAADPLLRYWAKPNSAMTVEPNRDWEKLASLACRHRPRAAMMVDRSAAYLEWRYGPGSPLKSAKVHLLRDARGNEGWFALGALTGKDAGAPLREALLLDLIWPADQLEFKDVLGEIVRVASEEADAMYFRPRPGLDPSHHTWAIPRKLAAPRAYVKMPKGAMDLPLHQFEYDDSEQVAWRIPSA